jgi:hypothetical protein
MCYLNNKHGDATARVTFAVYMLLISYLTVLLILFSDLLDMLSLIYLVKYTSAYVILFSLIKLT